MKKSTIMESLINAQENPTVIIDKNYRIIAANTAYCTSYGLAPETVVGRCCHEVSHHSPVPCHVNGEDCPHQQVFSTNKPFEVMHVHYDNENRPDRVRIKAHPIQAADGERFLMESIHRLAPVEDLSCEEMRMVGKSPAFLAFMGNLTVAAKSDAPVLLYGESGVGKELAAHYVHEQSPRKGRSYVELNCAAIPEALCESELFGHERGAFTGCAGLKQGLFELAHEGTLFLDEIGELPLAMQAKLLRVLDTGEFRRVGGRDQLKVDVRVVAATNQNLMAMAAQGKFREDLYFRIAGIKVNIPPLRERRPDIPALAEVLMKRMCKSRGCSCQITKEAIERLVNHDFPGNIRELRNILQKAVALSGNGSGVVTADHIHLNDHNIQQSGDARHTHSATGAKTATDASASMSEVESRYIAELLDHHDGNRRKVASVLGISERTLYRKIKQYEIGLSLN